jgi:hypothetical protein
MESESPTSGGVHELERVVVTGKAGNGVPWIPLAVIAAVVIVAAVILRMRRRGR